MGVIVNRRKRRVEYQRVKGTSATDLQTIVANVPIPHTQESFFLEVKLVQGKCLLSTFLSKPSPAANMVPSGLLLMLILLAISYLYPNFYFYVFLLTHPTCKNCVQETICGSECVATTIATSITLRTSTTRATVQSENSLNLRPNNNATLNIIYCFH